MNRFWNCLKCQQAKSKQKQKTNHHRSFLSSTKQAAVLEYQSEQPFENRCKILLCPQAKWFSLKFLTINKSKHYLCLNYVLIGLIFALIKMTMISCLFNNFTAPLLVIIQ